MSRTWYGVIIAVLVLLNAVLLYQNWPWKAMAERTLTDPALLVGNLQLPDVNVLNRRGETTGVTDIVSRNRHSLLIFASPGDCPSCISEKELWAEVPDRGSIPVIGLCGNSDASELWSWIDNENITIPVWLDTSFALLDTMDLRVTPLKVLADSTGRVLWADPTRSPGAPRERFWEDLNYALHADN